VLDTIFFLLCVNNMIDELTEWDDLQSEIISCRRCPRLVAWRERVARERRRAYRDWEYWGKPVPGFGDRQGRMLIVGLAPGAHGANRTGRVFTGDSSGNFLYGALHQAGFANQPASQSRDDGLHLRDVFISAICRCAPPANKPAPQEIANCLPFLQAEWDLLGDVRVVVALGQLAFDHTLRLMRTQGHNLPRLKFFHGAVYNLEEHLPYLVASYHPSRQNTQTGRLTAEMFADIWRQASDLL
jgi:uracil-DNA glycosylase